MLKRIFRLFEPEVFFNTFLMVLGIVVVVVSWGYGFGTIKRPGPGVYPFFLGMIIIFPSSLVLIIQGVKSPRREPLFDGSSLKTFLLMNLSFVFWIVSLPFLGYVIGTFCATFAFSKIMKLEGWVKPSIMSFCTSLLVYLLFDVWLYIDLPRGLLGV